MKKFSKGQRVKLTQKAIDNYILPKKPNAIGTITSDRVMPRSPDSISVRVDGQKASGRYHISFWEPIDSPQPEQADEK